jgi:hypothetical protein
MSTLVTRAGKGSPLTHNEVDANFTNLNTDKVEKTSADITGGTINGTTVGATTPAAGTFTTLTATGQTSLGGVANAEGLRVLNTASATRYVQIEGSVSGQPRVQAAGATTPLALSGNGAQGLSFWSNSFATEQMRVSHTASAVNYVQVTGAGTAGSPVISSQGSDTNVGLRLSSKGAFNISFWSNNNTNQQFSINGGVAAVNRLEAAGSVAGTAPSLSAIGSDTNIPLVLQPKGTGALQAQQTDSTATGGNARGAYATDFQKVRANAAQVASNYGSVVVGGESNIASGYESSILGGATNTANGLYTLVGGGYANTSGGSTGGTVVNGYTNNANGFWNFIGNGAFNAGTSASAVTTQSATMNGTTAVTLSGSNASIKVGQLLGGTYMNNFPHTYVTAVSGTSLTLSQAATGSGTATLSFYTPHGVVVGGGNNQATGSYSFIGGGGDAGTAANRNVASGDWSVVGGGAKNVASGIGSVVVGGGFDTSSGIYGNTASGASAFVGGGISNTASGSYSISLGGGYNSANSAYSVALGAGSSTTRSISGNIVGGIGNTSGSNGVSQFGFLVLYRQTTDATPTVLASTTSAAGTTNQVILPNNSAYAFKGTVIANVTGGGNTKAWSIEGAIKRGANAASTALVGTPTVTSAYADVGAATWAITATADTTNGGLAITFTGQAGTTIRVVAKLETTEVTF